MIHIVLAVASSGIAATLLDGGSTAHSRFKIPLDTTNEITYNIKKGTDRAELIKRAKLIFWDEAPMQHKHDFTAVSCTLSNLCDVSENVSLGGKVVCFCGDFRQTLPVVPGRPRGTIINMCIQRLAWWHEVKILRLSINMRLQDPTLNNQGRQEATKFAQDVLDIGNAKDTEDETGFAPWRHGYLPVNTREALINKMYPHLNTTISSAKYLSQRAILAVANVDVLEINNFCVDKLQGPVFLKHSSNVPVDPEMRENYGNECFHHYTEASLPPHILRLKVGMPVMILRNLEPPI